MANEPPPILDPQSTIQEGRAWVATYSKKPGGVLCPCCNARAAVYRRKINPAMCLSLIHMVRITREEKPRDGWFHVFDRFFAEGRNAMEMEFSKLPHWDLIEAGNPAGIWRVTHLGFDFVDGNASVPKYVRLYQNEPQGFEGPPVTVTEALGDRISAAEKAGWKLRPRQPFGGNQLGMF